MTRLLDVRGLVAGYDGTPIVRDLDLCVEGGEVVALMGSNGAGKTTVVRTIAGLLPAMQGRVEVLGDAVSARQHHLLFRRGLAYVPDHRALFPSLSVRENLSLAARRGRSSPAEVYLYLPKLAQLEKRRVGLLSGGEQQMVAVARALLLRPRLLLIDELSMGLAPIVVSSLLTTIRQAANDLGIGVLMIEQHLHLILGIADRAYVLRHGELALSGTTREIAAATRELEQSYFGEGAAPS